MKYIRRNVLDLILPRFNQENIISITGPRQAGKTTLCEVLIPQLLELPLSYISFDDPDERLRFQRSAVSILESLDTPLVILDEIQKMPSIFDPLKYVADQQKKRQDSHKKTFIITGSSRLILIKNIRETLAGRVALFDLYPFSLSEIVNHTEPVVLTSLWQQDMIISDLERKFHLLPPEKTRERMAKAHEHRTWGGYPPVWQRTDQIDKLNWLKDYRRTYMERDLYDVGQVADIDAFAMVQKLLCARTAQILSLSEVARDVSLAVNTVKRYLQMLAASFQCFLLQPYYENVGKRFIKSPKLYFLDTGLIKALLGEMSISSGALYENWVLVELIKWKQLQRIEPDLFFYRTSGGMEIDFLIAGEGGILPIEIKSSESVSAADGRALEAFLSSHAKVAKLGLIVYPGREMKEVRKNIWAMPDWFLLV